MRTRVTTRSATKLRLSPRGWAAIGAVLLIAALAVWWLASWDSSPGDDAAGDRMVEAIAAMPDGREVDLGEVLAIPWDRAVLIEPYSDGVAMNERLGFRGFADNASGPADEASQLVAFVRGASVVATATLMPEPGSFNFEPSITEFARDDATFVVERNGARVMLVRP
jgi:hypothetical protein